MNGYSYKWNPSSKLLALVHYMELTDNILKQKQLKYIDELILRVIQLY